MQNWTDGGGGTPAQCPKWRNIAKKLRFFSKPNWVARINIWIMPVQNLALLSCFGTSKLPISGPKLRCLRQNFSLDFTVVNLLSKFLKKPKMSEPRNLEGQLGSEKDRKKCLIKILWIFIWTSQICLRLPLFNAISTFLSLPFWLELIWMKINALIWQNFFLKFLKFFFFDFFTTCFRTKFFRCLPVCRASWSQLLSTVPTL